MMYFGTRAKVGDITNSTVQTCNGTVDVVKSFKYLGIMLDGGLKFDMHVDYMTKKIYPKLKTLGKVRSYIGVKTAITLFNSLIAPLFSFNDYIFDPMSASDANKLQVLHNACIQTCLNCDP